ncbi:hypothetical protein SAMN05216317_1288 [Nitrosomonas eutropha]|uniref:Uncharacterized protein n=1 Tax=Nitrosomonas eutropha TaxID=916 RepID=A0ABX5M766_9PROT|nr:hypothetical protein C8R14_1118 [Nitrosomonas eutropha]SCX25374.1 hypothetical protein SAMN05216379_12714 [Nitrosomonas eutropha]SDX06536.1 hypothetical protein SAMN05216317_1288 [Nitrosomonas eutropha]
MLYNPGFSVCILGNMVGKFSQGFSRANTDTGGQARPL